MEDDAMDLELVWTGPRNENHLDECIGVPGVFDRYTRQMENQFPLLNVECGEAEDEETIIDIKDYIDPSMLGCFFPNDSLGHGGTGPRKASRSARRVVKFIYDTMGRQEPSTSGGKTHSGRKNNDHWTQDEVRLLVKGVCEYGVGKWTDVKTTYFSTSIRTPVHLKDKWKNLVKACKKDSGRMLLPLEQSLIERIMEIDETEPYPKQSNSLSPTTTSPSLPPARWSVVKARSKRSRYSTRAQIEEQ